MITTAERKRRAAQSRRDRAAYQAEEQELERRRTQSCRDRARHLAEQLEIERYAASEQTFSQQDQTDQAYYSPPSYDLPPRIITSEKETIVPLVEDADVDMSPNVEFHGQLAAKLASHFMDPTYADATVTLGKTIIQLHRIVLCTQSEYFAKALSGDFAEASTRTLNCPEGKEPSYFRMLQFLYTGTYSNEIPVAIDIEDDDELLRDSRVYFMADEFFMHDLKDLALKRFQNKINQLWVTDGLTPCLQEIYANTLKKEDEIRGAAMRTVRSNVNDLLSRCSFRSLVAEGGDLAVELAEILSSTETVPAHGEYWD